MDKELKEFIKNLEKMREAATREVAARQEKMKKLESEVESLSAIVNGILEPGKEQGAK